MGLGLDIKITNLSWFTVDSVNVRARRIVKINLEHSSKYADKGIFAVFLYAFR